jgi:hypothetical protein
VTRSRARIGTARAGIARTGLVLFTLAAAAACVDNPAVPSQPGAVHQIVAPEIGRTFNTAVPDGPGLAITVGGGQRGSAGAMGRPTVDGDVIDLFVDYRPTASIVREALPPAWKAVAGNEIVGNVEVSMPELAAGRMTSATIEFLGVPTGEMVTIRYEDGDGIPFTMTVAP